MRAGIRSAASILGRSLRLGSRLGSLGRHLRVGALGSRLAGPLETVDVTARLLPALRDRLRMVLTLMLQEKAKEVEEADAGAAVARACGVDNK